MIASLSHSHFWVLSHQVLQRLVFHLVYVRVFVHLQQFRVQYVIMFTVYRAYLSYLVYTYLFILISTASCSILLVRNETSYLSIVFDFLSYSLKSVGRLFPVHLDFSSLISLEAF